jgi:hypothetical protein
LKWPERIFIDKRDVVIEVATFDAALVKDKDIL